MRVGLWVMDVEMMAFTMIVVMKLTVVGKYAVSVSENSGWSMQWMQLTVDGIDSSSSKVSNLHVIFPSMQDRWMQWSERN